MNMEKKKIIHKLIVDYHFGELDIIKLNLSHNYYSLHSKIQNGPNCVTVVILLYRHYNYYVPLDDSRRCFRNYSKMREISRK